MVALSRLVGLFLLFLGCGVSHAAGSVAINTSPLEFRTVNCIGLGLSCSGPYGSSAAASSGSQSYMHAQNAGCGYHVTSYAEAGDGTATWTISPTAACGTSAWSTSRTGGSVCPSNSAASGGACTCNASYHPNTGASACVADTSCDITATTMDTVGIHDAVGLYSGTTLCQSGCNIQATMSAQQGGYTWYYPPFRNLGGASCTAATTPTSAAAQPLAASSPTQCPLGQAPGTVNGATVCVPVSSSTTTTTDTTTTPAGAASAPVGVVAGTTTRQTTCTGNACVTVTTMRDASGMVIGTQSVGESQGEFCKDNPDVSVCKDSQFGGNCAAGFSCEGDAIQCAISKDQHLRNCTIFESTHTDATSGLSKISAGNAATAPFGTDPGTPGNPHEVDVGAMLSMPSNPYSSACLADIVYSTSFGVITIPLAAACPAFVLMGQMAVAFTLLSAAGWLVMKGTF